MQDGKRIDVLGAEPAAPELRGDKTTPNRVRQGVTGHNVRYVLSLGTLGAVIALVVFYVFFFAATG